MIRGGRVVDGTGNPWFYADVGIRDGRIVTVGQLAGADATRVIDATGLVIAPGFIDLHTHSDSQLLADGTAQSKIRQGVTLDIAGESTSPGPRDGMPATVGRGVPSFRSGYGRVARISSPRDSGTYLCESGSRAIPTSSNGPRSMVGGRVSSSRKPADRR